MTKHNTEVKIKAKNSNNHKMASRVFYWTNVPFYNIFKPSRSSDMTKNQKSFVHYKNQLYHRNSYMT